MTRYRTARLTLDPAFTVGEVDRRLFGSFVEHMGRCVYAGIYEPGHPTADADGFRRRRARPDPRARRHPGPLPRRQLRLRLPLGGRRRPGRTGARPAGPGLARHRDRTSSALDEFMAWAARGRRRADDGGQPRHPRHPGGPATCSSTATTRGGTRLSDLRRSHGAEEPHGITAVVPGQRDGRPVADRAQDRRRVRPARRRDRPGDAAWSTRARTGRLRQLQLRGCPPSARGRRRCSSTPTTRRLHLAARLLRGDRRRPGQLPGLRRSTWTRFIDAVVATADHVGAQLRSRKRIKLSFDEWNVWYQSRVRRPAPTSTGRGTRR